MQYIIQKAAECSRMEATHIFVGAHGVFMGGSDFAKDFGPEVGIRDERICQANEILEDWQITKSCYRGAV